MSQAEAAALLGSAVPTVKLRERKARLRVALSPREPHRAPLATRLPVDRLSDELDTGVICNPTGKLEVQTNAIPIIHDKPNRGWTSRGAWVYLRGGLPPSLQAVAWSWRCPTAGSLPKLHHEECGLCQMIARP
jgi:hypothetical protein